MLNTAAPSRRSIIRAAAWTAPAVSIAVAAPAFATSHETLTAALSAPNAPYKGTVSGSLKFVKWDGLTLTNTAASTGNIEGLTVLFTGYAESSGARPDTMTVTTTSGNAGTWSASPATTSATWSGMLLPGQTLTFNVGFTGNNNSGGTLTMSTSSTGNPSLGTVSGRF